jgi:hypothetical protein
MISANHFIFRSDRTMLAAREDPGEAGLWVRNGCRQPRPEPAVWDNLCPPGIGTLRMGQSIAEKSFHDPGTPFNSHSPHSSNAMPDPTTRSFTVLETRTSPGAAKEPTRAAI